MYERGLQRQTRLYVEHKKNLVEEGTTEVIQARNRASEAETALNAEKVVSKDLRDRLAIAVEQARQARRETQSVIKQDINYKQLNDATVRQNPLFAKAQSNIA